MANQQTSEQRTAAAQMRGWPPVAERRRRVTADAEGWPVIPGRYGQIEWLCGGVDCHSCPMPGQLALAVYTDRPRIIAKLSTLPGVRRYQTGDSEGRMVFEPSALARVAEVIQARRRRPPTPGRPAEIMATLRSTRRPPQGPCAVVGAS
jgi:hypothetical protein